MLPGRYPQSDLLPGVPFTPGDMSRLSAKPGVYLMKGSDGEILYIGKAKSLRARLRSYLGSDATTELRTQELVAQVTIVETLVVGSEAEALILEANLIKEHQPRFNIQLRDDKKYPYIKVTVGEPFPRAYVTRRVRKDGSRYFGPFVSVGRVRRALDIAKRLHFVRSCRYKLPAEAPARPCLDLHIGRCRAPCVGMQSQAEYARMIDRLLEVLAGDVGEIQVRVEEQMRQASAKMEFERAAVLRNTLAGLDGIARQQRVQAVGGGDQDVLGLARDRSRAVVVILRIRNGVLLGRDARFLSEVEGEADAALVSRVAMETYLSGGSSALEQLPSELLLPVDFPDRELLTEALTGLAERKVEFRLPQHGTKRRLVDLATANARHVLDDAGAAGAVRGQTDDVLYELQDRLELKVVPRLIVGFDASHTQGSEAVASAVLFQNGDPRKSGYRHMKVREGKGSDDYKSLGEALRRYFARRQAEDEHLPDLVVMDGGKGQLSAARAALREMELTDLPVVALAKREEVIYAPGDPEGLRLPRTAPALHLLQRIRDEAHRFAVGYSRKLRSQRTIRSELADIPGVGPARQKALLSRFGSLRSVREATPAEIARIPGLGDILAIRILTYLKGGIG